jgi:hypothetical protein
MTEPLAPETSALPPCDAIQPRLSELVDDDLDPADRAAIETHVRGCARCAALVEDLGRIRQAARGLGAIDPPPHVWLEIAGQIRQATPTSEAVRPAARAHQRWQWIGLAAALLVSTAGAYYYVRIERRPAAPPVPVATTASAASVDVFTDELTQAMTHYEKAIGELETLTKSNNGTLDPAVAATLQKNLTVIDDAIAESRTAMTRDPTSIPARDSLLEALQRKVSVLQETVALINEIRKGDQAGAARIVSGLGRQS